MFTSSFRITQRAGKARQKDVLDSKEHCPVCLVYRHDNLHRHDLNGCECFLPK